MLGPDFHESVPPEASLWVPGSAGISLHAGPYGGGYTVRGDGALACEQVNVAWQLRDVTAADGGFVRSHTLTDSTDPPKPFSFCWSERVLRLAGCDLGLAQGGVAAAAAVRRRRHGDGLRRAHTDGSG